MELRLTTVQHEWREEVRDFPGSEWPGGIPGHSEPLFTRHGRNAGLDLGDERYHRERTAAALAV